jgi:hypothetical protein
MQLAVIYVRSRSDLQKALYQTSTDVLIHRYFAQNRRPGPSLLAVAEDGPGFLDRYKKEYTAEEELAKTLQERQKKLKVRHAATGSPCSLVFLPSCCNAESRTGTAPLKFGQLYSH